MNRSVVATCILISSVAAIAAEPQWHGWRGPGNNGHSADKSLPVKWTPNDVAWRVELKGRGQSSPIVVGDRIFLTSAEDNGRIRLVMCRSRTDGSEVWTRIAWTGVPEKSHNMNGWASATCTTDGERVYVFFGKGGGLFCYSLEGEPLWEKNLGEFAGPWGTAAAPLLVGDLVIQNCDADVDAFIIGLDKKTGNEVWRTKRQDARGWSSPILINVNDHQEVVVNGQFGLQAYDPKTGEDLWFCKSFSGRGTPTVTLAGSVLHAVCGLRGDTYAVKPGGKGDVTKTHMAWHLPRNCSRDLPSPIVLKDQSLVMDMRRGALTSYDYQNGKENWRERVADVGSVGQFCATPVAWNDTAFFVTERGKAFAIRAGEAMDVVSVNEVNSTDEEIFRSSITPDNGQLLLRSNSALYCIGK